MVPVTAEEEDEEDDEEEAEEEESVTVLHPALAEAADLDASLVGLAARLASLRGGRGPAALLELGREEDDDDKESAFLRFCEGVLGAPLGPGCEALFLLRALPDMAGAGSAANLLFLDLVLTDAGAFFGSESSGEAVGAEGPLAALTEGWLDNALGRLAGLGK